MDPYSILGVSRTDSDEKIKEAYRELVKKYHPDSYAGNPLADLADEKMKEINEAFDMITAERRSNGSGSTTRTAGNYTGSGVLNEIAALINAGKIIDAEQMLDGISARERSGGWHYLKGSIFVRRGWLDEASSHFRTACEMEPGNAEFRAAYNRLAWQRQGYNGGAGGYNTGGYGQGNYNPNGCNFCNICAGVLCADFLCNCCC